jgi:tetratricopeptide (TPR) repeat protein
MNGKKRSNVIPIPNLKERYLDMGTALLKSKKYQEALEMFSQAKKLNEGEAEIYLGMAICLMELGELVEAKEICKKMLREDIGHYFTVLQIYLTILIQLREYLEVQLTIEAVLEENHLPAESAEHFYKLLEFSRKMTQNDANFIEDDEMEDEANQPLYLEDILEDPTKQIDYIQSLRDRNLSKHFSALKILLENPASHPMVKSMILHVMIENEVEKEVTVYKFGESITIIPAKLEDISELPFTKRVLTVLDDTLGNENPTLFEAVKELWIRHLYVLFPFLPQPADTNLWAAAFHLVGYEMHGITIDTEEIQASYGVPLPLLNEACKKIYQIEEISYMQI